MWACLISPFGILEKFLEWNALANFFVVLNDRGLKGHWYNPHVGMLEDQSSITPLATQTNKIRK